MGHSIHDPAFAERRPWKAGRTPGAKRALKPQQIRAIRFWRGHEAPQFDDFSIAIWSVVAISLCSVFVNLRFDKNAGAEMARRVPAEEDQGSSSRNPR